MIYSKDTHLIKPKNYKISIDKINEVLQKFIYHIDRLEFIDNNLLIYCIDNNLHNVCIIVNINDFLNNGGVIE